MDDAQSMDPWSTPGTEWASPESPPGMPRPSGKDRSVVAVVLLYIVTIGIYGIVWGWKATRELDAFARPVKPSHPIFRRSVFFLLGAVAAVVVGIATLVAAADLGQAGDPWVFLQSAGAMAAVAILFFIAGAGLLVTALVLDLMSMFQFTRTLEGEGRVRFGPEAANATLLFVLFLLGMLLQRGGSVLTIVAIALSQSAMNKMWRVSAGPPPSRPAVVPIPS